MKIRLVRRAQTLSPFGVGAVFDVEGESLVAADITYWKNEGQELFEPRLEKLLDVRRFKMGPPAPDNPSGYEPGIPYFRFPQWLFCPRCRNMLRWSLAMETGNIPECQLCMRGPRSRLVPMRFVMACPRGHLADVPWGLWAHSGSHGKCERHALKFNTHPGGSGLEYVEVACSACGARRSLAGIATPDSMQVLHVSCPGRQPWQRNDEAKSCNAVPQVLQRGATNLTFAVTASSIDIPPFSNWTTFNSERRLIAATDEFRVIRSAPNSPALDFLIETLANRLNMPVEKVRSLVNAELREAASGSGGNPLSEYIGDTMLGEEFDAFLAPDEEPDPRDRFIKRHVPLNDFLKGVSQGPHGSAIAWLGERLDALIQVTRLREIRVLRGFSRLAPVTGNLEEGEGPGTFSVYGPQGKIVPTMVPADLGLLNQADRWLPAIEVFGEGIFLNFSELEVQQWEDLPPARMRIQSLVDRHTRVRSSSFLPSPVPRFVLLHTLAHLLIRQLSFECGYPLASLRERIYAAEPDTGRPMAGILIYTAAGDVEGTLGGLVREGEAGRLLSTITKALQQASWCSSDPLCRESRGQGMDAMNLAACHACALLPETSCLYSNRLLDRALLLGSTDDDRMGFFAPLMEQLLQAAGEVRWGM